LLAKLFETPRYRLGLPSGSYAAGALTFFGSLGFPIPVVLVLPVFLGDELVLKALCILAQHRPGV